MSLREMLVIDKYCELINTSIYKLSRSDKGTGEAGPVNILGSGNR